MQTNKINKSISLNSVLGKASQKLIKAAYDYWKVYQKQVGPCAVVWVEGDDGHFVLFTRSEYKDAIMSSANRETMHEPILFKPFEKKK